MSIRRGDRVASKMVRAATPDQAILIRCRAKIEKYAICVAANATLRHQLVEEPWRDWSGGDLRRNDRDDSLAKKSPDILGITVCRHQHVAGSNLKAIEVHIVAQPVRDDTTYGHFAMYAAAGFEYAR